MKRLAAPLIDTLVAHSCFLFLAGRGFLSRFFFYYTVSMMVFWVIETYSEHPSAVSLTGLVQLGEWNGCRNPVDPTILEVSSLVTRQIFIPATVLK